MLCVGLGGLGCPASLYLAAAGEVEARRAMMTRIDQRLLGAPDPTWVYWLERALAQLVYSDEPVNDLGSNHLTLVTKSGCE